MTSACLTAVSAFKGGEWKERGPGLTRTPVRAPERLKKLFECRPPERPHEPSPVPDQAYGQRLRHA
jgi:hypothetical protein